MPRCRACTVYLEISFFSTCVGARKDPQSLGWRTSGKQWWRRQAKYHDLFISAEVIRELQNPNFPRSATAIAMLRGLSLLTHTPEAIELARLFVRERVMPGPALEGDALHLATATVHQMDYILSWNVRHLANPNKRVHLAVICMRLNLNAPQIVTPDALWEPDDG